MCKVTIDCRERELIQYSSVLYDGDQIVTKALDIGDILVESSKCAILIERKTIADFVASISDGRLEEQHYRMKAWKETVQQEKQECRAILLYLIEGSRLRRGGDRMFGRFKESSLQKFMDSFCIRHCVPFLYSRNVEQSAALIARLVENCTKKPDYYHSPEQNASSYHSLTHQRIHVKKKNNLSHSAWTKHMYENIPGINKHMATALFDQYPSWKDLIEVCDLHFAMYQSSKTPKKYTFPTITWETSTKKKRTITQNQWIKMCTAVLPEQN